MVEDGQEALGCQVSVIGSSVDEIVEHLVQLKEEGNRDGYVEGRETRSA